MILNLNPVMSIIANVPAAIASTVCLYNPLKIIYRLFFQIAASRVVRRLANFSTTGAEVFSSVVSDTLLV
jgi:hypothetical protein